MDWNQLFATWYSWLSSLNAALSEPVSALSEGIGVPFLSAFLFGLLGTTAPCQLSTNLGALAFLGRHPAERGATARAALAFVAGKVLVYTALGAVILLAGQQLFAAAGPTLEWARKLIGPAMLIMGLVVLGVLRLRVVVPAWVSSRVSSLVPSRLGERPGAPAEHGEHASSGPPVPAPRRRAPERAPAGLVASPVASQPGAGYSVDAGGTGAIAEAAPRSHKMQNVAYREDTADTVDHAPGAAASFLLGVAFSLAFCPTLALLFFGVTMTLAARSTAGVTFPAFFALGTALPLFLLLGVTLTGAGAARTVRKGLRRANRPLRWLAGGLLVLLGLHDTFVYWLL